MRCHVLNFFLRITNRLLGLVNMEVGGRQVGELTQVGGKKLLAFTCSFDCKCCSSLNHLLLLVQPFCLWLPIVT